MRLTRGGPLPLYHQLKTVILREIEAGRWKPQEQLPTEDELAHRFQVSKITVRQALGELASSGYIRRQQGRGTFVEQRRLQQGPRELMSFTEEMRRHGLAASSTVLQRAVVPAPPKVANALRIAPGAPVFTLRRLRLANREPLGIQTACLPMDLVPGIDRRAFADDSLYDFLQSQYGLYPATARETYCVVIVKRGDAGLLHVKPGSPAMGAERVTFMADGRPFEYVESIMRGDRYKVVLDLTKQ